MRKLLLSLFILILYLSLATNVSAQTTGKIAGIVLEAESGEALPGANIILEGTQMGASSGLEGDFFIINIAPGSYTVSVQMIGYKTHVIENLQVSVNRTAYIEASLSVAILEGEVIVVQAQKIAVKKDQTSSVRNISSAEMELLPVENLRQVVNMQAGVVNGHFRGGRLTEVTYMIDGMQVDNNFSGVSSAVTLETESVQDLEVITGTFNAEYGRAMSGIVNAITKEGGNQFHGSVDGRIGNYFSSNTDVFPGLEIGSTRNMSQDYRVQLEGPVLRDRLTFFLNYRYQDLNGHLNGIYRFNPNDYSFYSTNNPAEWHTEATGTGEYISMDNDIFHTLTGKLTFKATNTIKASLLYTLNDSKNASYNHYYKYNPTALRNIYGLSNYGAFTLNHMISPSLFYVLKVSYLRNISESYVYEDPLDSRYVHPKYAGSGTTGFATGGNASPGKSKDTFNDATIKWDVYWQASKSHSFKAGVSYINHEVDRFRVDVRNKYAGLNYENDFVVDSLTGKITFPFYELEAQPITDKTIDVYNVKPYEFAAYLQDKMEFDEMVINVGLRYDYFNSNQVYPSDRRNPANQLALPEEFMSVYEHAEPQEQLSPRFGLAYQLSDLAVLHISYGHFFQMPPMYALYANNIFRVPVNDYATTMGNTQLKPQKTIQYEIGFWQEVLQGMGLELALYYRDIYDLLSTKIISTYNQIEYGLYTNKDYGNARGLEVKWDYVFGNFFGGLNYTLSYTRGNADNPTQTFTRAGNSMDPIARLIPMSWDQRQTVNGTFRYSSQKWGTTLMGYYNSGTPYTYAPPDISPLSEINLYENNAYKPAGYTFDIMSYYHIPLGGKIRGQITLNIYNLFDNNNAVAVYSDTGQPYTTIIYESDIANHRSDFNDYKDRIENPIMFSSPRQIKIGFGIIF